MAEYIEREALLSRLKFKVETDTTYNHLKRRGLESAMAQVRKATAADVKYVIHSKWEITDIDHAHGHKCYSCPECGTDEWRYDPTNYCPNCGARMDGE